MAGVIGAVVLAMVTTEQAPSVHNSHGAEAWCSAWFRGSDVVLVSGSGCHPAFLLITPGFYLLLVAGLVIGAIAGARYGRVPRR